MARTQNMLPLLVLSIVLHLGAPEHLAHAATKPCADALLAEVLSKYLVSQKQNYAAGFEPIHLIIQSAESDAAALEAIQTLDSRIRNPNAVSDYGDTALSLAIQNRFWNTVRYLLNIEGIQTNTVDLRTGRTPFIDATFEKAPLDVLKLLKARGADPLHKNDLKPNETALTASIGNADLTTLKMMIEQFKLELTPSDFEAATRVRFGAQVRIERNLEERLSSLEASIPFAEARNNKLLRNAKKAAYDRALAFFSYLASFPRFTQWLHSNPVNSVYTPLMNVIASNDTGHSFVEIVRLFVERGANPNAVSNTDVKTTAIEIAIQKTDWPTVEYILSIPGYDANPVKDGLNFSSLLARALEYKAPFSTIDAFRAAGAYFDFHDGRTALLSHDASAMDIERLQVLMSEYKIETRIEDLLEASKNFLYDKDMQPWQKTSARSKFNQKRLELFKQLLSETDLSRLDKFAPQLVSDAMAQIISNNPAGQSAIEILRLFVKKGMNLNAYTTGYGSILDIAIFRQDERVIDFILSSPSENSRSIDALFHVHSYRDQSSVELLKKRTGDSAYRLLERIRSLKNFATLIPGSEATKFFEERGASF